MPPLLLGKPMSSSWGPSCLQGVRVAFALGPMAPLTSIMTLCQSWSFLFLSLSTRCHVLGLMALVGASWRLGFDGHKGL